ncbi:DUF1992 domain-containing protein [Streptomyces sp. NRRL F-5123]|uniref:DnaJ family domain-containing protein n=1 Tax=Streptomyces sp. NRRL F-5123 TaxID=1463856 RepID=UPI0007C593BE|nr:DUF1992 domain-containing protein [Streptomyces sp. NRRL F-5123]
MTERKPPGVPFETWADKQIRDAERRGDFAGLEGAGKPLPSLDEPYDPLWWVRRKMQTEGLSALPPSLVLRKRAEDAEAAAMAAPTEALARRIVEAVNEDLREALRRPPQGPPLMRGLFDVEQVAADWRAAHPAPDPAEQERERQQEQVPREAPAKGFRRLFRRRRPA